jgi:hypothetical protein
MPGPFQVANAWTDEFLDPMREVGDPPADAAIAALFAEGDIQSVNALMQNLVANEGYVPESLPAAVREFLATTEDLPPWANAEAIAIGENVFWEWGPQLILLLHCYSLPFCYAARKGVQVLALTSRLSGNAARRIVETAQMLVDVMQRGGLTSADGRGRRTLQKVRLMHAAVRHLASQSPVWNAEWNVPINQEDLAATLMSFSWVALDGLRRLGIELTAEQQNSYLHCWQIIGEQLGIREDMIPANLESAQALAEAFGRRQYGACPEGKEMTRALVQAMQYELPGNLLDPLPAFFIAYFMGKENAAVLGIQDEPLVGVIREPLSLFGEVLSEACREPFVAATAEKAGKLLLESTLLVARGGNRPAFSIPDALKEQWGVNWIG